jgi:hypothetical protein
MNGLPALAQNLSARGRNGDSMLVHMAPEEVSGLRSLALQQGTDLSINPNTGLPEAFKLKKLLRALAPMLPFILPMAAPLSLAMKAGISGLIGGVAAPGKGFNFKEGLKTGLMAFAGGKLMEGINAANAANVGAPTGAPTPSPATGGPVAGGYGDFTSGMTAGPAPIQSTALTPPPTAPTSVTSAAPIAAAAPVTPPPVATTAGTVAPAASPSFGQQFTSAVGVSPSTALIGGTTAVSLLQAEKEREIYKEQERTAQEEEERKRRVGLATFDRSLGQVPTYGASGGLVALARGGMTYMEAGGTTGPTGEPRMVAGTGDGMSDSVPATIEGVQEARLANDEFVIPADVVADIGNGSSSSGAKKLYDMMDRIRKARHGTTEQPPEISAEKYMPA